jgi:hypothetical protein
MIEFDDVILADDFQRFLVIVRQFCLRLGILRRSERRQCDSPERDESREGEDQNLMLPFFHYLLLFHTPIGMPVMNLRPSSGSAFFAKNRTRLPHSSHAPLIVKSRANEGAGIFVDAG